MATAPPPPARLPRLQGIVSSFESGAEGWEIWYRAGEPETAELPGEWESKCNELQRMLLVRCLRWVGHHYRL